MNNRTLFLSIVCLALASACTSIPRSDLAESQFAELDCAGLKNETAQAEETRRVASEARGDSWKVIVPIAVVARFGHAHAAASEADQRLESLAAEQARKGCVAVG